MPGRDPAHRRTSCRPHTDAMLPPRPSARECPGPETESQPRYQVLHGLRDKDLRGLGEGGDTSPNVDGNSRGLPVRRVDLTCVHTGANLDSERPNGLDDRLGALHPSRGAVERGKEAVAGDILLVTSITAEHRPHDRVMLLN